MGSDGAGRDDRYLISVGADPNAVDSDGVAPLHRAVRTRSLAAVRALLDGGANARQPTRRGRRLCTLPFKHGARRKRFSAST